MEETQASMYDVLHSAQAHHRLVPVVGSVEEVAASGVDGFKVQTVKLTGEPLPAEFFGRELMEVNASDDGQLMAFVAEWGFPYCPFVPAYGVDSNRLLTPRATKAHDGRRWFEGVRETDVLCDALGSNGMTISAREARETIERLQAEVAYYYELLEASAAGDVVIDASRMPCALNAGRAHVDALTAWGSTSNPLGARGVVPLTLTNAICNQFAATVGAGAPWKRCQCDGCGRLFKTVRPSASRSKNVSGERVSPNDALYCSDKCRKKQSRINRSLAKQTRGK